MGSAGGKNLNQHFFFFLLISIILAACWPHFVRASGVWWIDGEMVKSPNFPFSCPSHANKIQISFKPSTLHIGTFDNSLTIFKVCFFHKQMNKKSKWNINKYTN
jgi:hypothetical protein